jgi:hypothetical protein
VNPRVPAPAKLDKEIALLSNARRGDPMHGAAGMPLFVEIS